MRAIWKGAVAFGLAMLCAYVSIFREIALPFGDRQLAARDWIPLCIVAAMVFARARSVERKLMLYAISTRRAPITDAPADG